MKKIVLSFAMMAAFGVFIANSNANSVTASNSTVLCDGGHECSDKCKKNKEGKCAEASTDVAGKSTEAKSCCSKDKKSCTGDEKKKKESKGKKQNQDPKS